MGFRWSLVQIQSRLTMNKTNRTVVLAKLARRFFVFRIFGHVPLALRLAPLSAEFIKFQGKLFADP
jgi:hypothetical protein